jgi:hypothetical protein
MLRLRPPTSVVPHTVRWPAFKLGDPSTVFSSRPPLRELTVVIDDEICESAHEGLMTKPTVLLGLLSHDYVTLLRYRDEGPGEHVPADAPPGPTHVRSSPAPGWLVVAPAGPDGYHQQVAARFGDSVHHAAIFGDAPDAAEHDVDGSYEEFGDDEARARRRADAIAVQAASAVGAGIYVTRRPYLHTVTWDLAFGVLVATPEDVLALISLYLRTQGEFITYRSFDGGVAPRSDRLAGAGRRSLRLTTGAARHRGALHRHRRVGRRRLYHPGVGGACGAQRGLGTLAVHACTSSPRRRIVR